MERREKQAFALFGCLLISLFLLNVFGVLSDYYLNLFGKYLSLILLALGLDLVWGYAGILSLCQAIFFGLGAYAIGMHMMLAGSGQGVYGEQIPDFMVWNQIYELPAFWKPFHSLAFTLMAGVLLPALAAGLVGLLTFRRRVRGTYFAILSQAIAFAFWLMINRNEMMLGGTNGLTDFKSLLGFPLSNPATQRGLYLVTAVFAWGGLLACRLLVHARFGLVLRAARDNEKRLESLGYDVSRYKMAAFVLAGGLAGLSGLLYTPQVGIITPSQVGVLPSLEVVIWVAFGGRGTLWGAALGAVTINALRSFLTASYPRVWPILLGSLFVLVTIFLPAGLLGLGERARRKRAKGEGDENGQEAEAVVCAKVEVSAS